VDKNVEMADVAAFLDGSRG